MPCRGWVSGPMHVGARSSEPAPLGRAVRTGWYRLHVGRGYRVCGLEPPGLYALLGGWVSGPMHVGARSSEPAPLGRAVRTGWYRLHVGRGYRVCGLEPPGLYALLGGWVSGPMHVGAR